jgi:ATP/maltotriose-dependent transcriptional regulator MalT
LELLEEAPATPERFLLAAHIYKRLRQPDDALAMVALAASGPSHTPEQLGLAAALRLTALTMKGAAGEADFRSAETYAELIPSEHVAAEIYFHLGYSAWMQNDVERARKYLDASPRGDVHAQAQRLILQGWLLAHDGSFKLQATLILRAISMVKRQTTLDSGTIGPAIHALVMLARDLHLPEASALVREVEPTMTWGEGVAVEHFQTLRGLAWAKALEGNYIDAFRALNRATLLAPAPTWRMLAHLDASTIATLSRQDAVAEAELQDGMDIIDGLNLSRASGEEAGALLVAAELLAPGDCRRARSLYADALAIFERMPPNAGFKHGRRFEALCAYTDAVLRERAGDRRNAGHRARLAFTLFKEAGYEWRAARAALLIFKMRGDAQALQDATEIAALYPNSFIDVEVSRVRNGRDPFETLTARQKQVVDLVAKGLKNREIAKVLDLSLDTIKNHNKAIRLTLGYGTYKKLLAELAARRAA